MEFVCDLAVAIPRALALSFGGYPCLCLASPCFVYSVLGLSPCVTEIVLARIGLRILTISTRVRACVRVYVCVCVSVCVSLGMCVCVGVCLRGLFRSVGTSVSLLRNAALTLVLI